MKRISTFNYIIFCFVFLGLFACEEPKVENGFRINGKLDGATGEISLLRYDGNATKIETIAFGNNGSFKFELPNAKKAAYVLQHNTTIYPFVYANDDENELTLNAIADNPLKGDYEVTGSEGSILLQEYFKKYRTGSITLKDYTTMVNSPSHPYVQSFMTSRCLNYGSQSNVTHIKALNNLKTADPTAKLVLHYDNAIKKSMNDLNKRKRRSTDGPLSIGEVAPNIRLPNPDGKMMTLSELQGKVVVVDFWASWCGPCRSYGNPKLVKLYNKYDKDKFAIMNVALERGTSNAKWVDAIKKDGLVWPYQVVDKSRKFSPLYGASTIPRIYLLDKTVKIAAINPSTKDLEKTIEELL